MLGNKKEREEATKVAVLPELLRAMSTVATVYESLHSRRLISPKIRIFSKTISAVSNADSV